MLAVRGNRPFSLDQKLPNLDSHLPAGRRICEIRLLAVEKQFRGAPVLQGILALLWQHGLERATTWPSSPAPRANSNCIGTWASCRSARW